MGENDEIFEFDGDEAVEEAENSFPDDSTIDEAPSNDGAPTDEGDKVDKTDEAAENISAEPDDSENESKSETSETVKTAEDEEDEMIAAAWMKSEGQDPRFFEKFTDPNEVFDENELPDYGSFIFDDYDPSTEPDDGSELDDAQLTTQDAKTSFITLLTEMVKDAIKSMRDRRAVNRAVNQAAKMAEQGEDVESDVELDDVTKLKIDILAEKMFPKYAGTSEGETASGERFFKSMAETTAKLAGGELTDDALEKTAERFMKTSAGKELGKYIKKHNGIKSEVLRDTVELAEKLSKCDSVESVVDAAVNDLDIGVMAIKIGQTFDSTIVPDISSALPLDEMRNSNCNVVLDRFGYGDLKDLHTRGLKSVKIDGKVIDLEAITSTQNFANDLGLVVDDQKLYLFFDIEDHVEKMTAWYQIPKTDEDQITVNLGNEAPIDSGFFNNVKDGQKVILHSDDLSLTPLGAFSDIFNLDGTLIDESAPKNFTVLITNDAGWVYDEDNRCHIKPEKSVPAPGAVIEVINGIAETREETQDEFAARLAEERPEEYRDFLADTRQSTAGWSQEELADYLGEDWEGFEEDRAEAIAEANRIEAIAEAEAEVESKPIIIFPDDEAEHIPAPEASSDSTAEAETVVETNEAVDDAVPAADATPVEPAANEAVADEQGDGLSDAVVGLLDYDVPVEAANDALVTDEAVTEAVAPAVLDEPVPEASEAPTETVGGTDIFADSAAEPVAEPAVDSAAEAANDTPTVEAAKAVDNTSAESVTVSVAEGSENAEQASGLSGAGAVSANEASNGADQVKDNVQEVVEAQNAAEERKSGGNKHSRGRGRKLQ